MKDNYLWDGSGEPDPEIQKLETALGRFDAAAHFFSALLSQIRRRGRNRRRDRCL